MRGSGLPTPTVESLAEAKELIERLHAAWETAGGDTEMTIGALLVIGAATGIDEAALAALQEAAGVVVAVYITACIACLASSGIDALRELFAMSPSQPFMTEELSQLGIDVDEADAAIA
jgi:hypothetical protein